MKFFNIKKGKLSFVLFLFSALSYGQQTPQSFLPNITPPAPEAFSITKYGDIPIDEFNGKVNLDVPIYEYKAGQLKLPISLNYYGAGVKVKDIPTQVGINFTLNAGGVIAREIRDIADESMNRIILTQSELMALNGPDCSSEAQTLRTYLDNNQNDTEVDVFNFNFSGYRGSFYLDKTLTPKMTKNDNELKIQIIGNLANDKTFLITDPTGIKYYFGGVNAIEYSGIDNMVNGVHSLNVASGVTSFYLYKIEHPINGTINLEYETISDFHYTLNSEWTKTINTPYLLASNCEETELITSYSYNITRNYISNPKYLKKISSLDNQEEMIFVRTYFNQNALNTPLKTALNSITIKNNTVIKNKIDLTYIGLNDLNSVKRFFLSKIEFNKNNIVAGKNDVYQFDYNDADGLPALNSYKIDRLGYFNNKNNQDLIPCFPEDYTLLCPNRSSDFNYASKGVLKKVIFPTKGYTQFEYEQQPFVEKKYTNISANVYSNATGGLDDEAVFINGRYQKLHDELPKTIIDEDGIQHTVFEMPIIYSQTVSITLAATTTNNSPSDRRSSAIIKIINLTTNTTTIKQTSTNLVFNYTFNSSDTYRIELDLQLPNIEAEGYSTSGLFSFDLHTGYHAPTGWGVRLKKVNAFESNNSLPNIKRYYYKPYHKLNDIHADTSVLNDNSKAGAWIKKCTSAGSFDETIGFSATFNIINTKTKSSEYNFSDFTFNNLYFDYATICTSYGGDNFELGGIEKTFGIEEAESPFKLYPTSSNAILDFSEGNANFPYSSDRKVSNRNPINGTLLKEKVFANKSNAIVKVKETVYQYDSNYTFGFLNIFGNELFNEFPPNPPVCGGYYQAKTLSNYNIFTYFNKVYDFKKTSQKEVNYIDPIPASIVAHEPTGLDDSSIVYPTQDQLEAPYKKVITTQTYEYSTLKGLPTKVTTTVSGGGTKSTENVYVNQAVSLSGLTANQSTAYTALLNQNNVASPIETHQLENGTLLSKQRTTYQTLAGNKIVPEIIQTAKGTANLEDRAVFEEYDSKGNPTLMALTGGSKIKYVYNNLNQVIAKIENFTGTLDPNTNSIADACAFINQYPNSQVSVFKYDAITNLLVEKFDANCQKTTYIYDALYRLKQIKDNDNNVIQEFDNNYRPN